MIADTMPCVTCGADLESAIPAGTAPWQRDNQPYAGTTFISFGHYGSTVFDPMDNNNTWLELNFCDKCLKVFGDRGVVLLRRRNLRRTETWQPDKELRDD